MKKRGMKGVEGQLFMGIVWGLSAYVLAAASVKLRCRAAWGRN
jgi:hypothetical protein